MTKEDKKLLLKDLSARLPYEVIVRHADPLIDNDGNEIGEFWYKRGYLCNITTLDDITTTIIESEGSDEEGYEHICDLERSLPYLRLMSSMTNEEREDFYRNRIPFDGNMWRSEGNDVDWLNKHHFDYRGLIPKGLAIEVTEENNLYKE